MVKWWLAGLMAAAAFSLVAWISGAFLLPLLMKSPADRWALAAGLGVAVAALVGLWAQSWATSEGRTAPSGDRMISAGGEISGIASTGDNTTNTQHR